MASSLVAAYTTAKIVLWIEDEATEAYLSQAWGSDPDIVLMMAGPRASVEAMVRDAQKRQIKHVFGLVDRDFSSTNRPKWLAPNAPRVLLPSVHEVENWLVDPVAWAALTGPFNPKNRTETELDGKMETAAKNQTWYMAARQVLSEMSKASGPFPRHPKPKHVLNESQAVQWVDDQLAETDWLNNNISLAARTILRCPFRRRMRELEVDYAAMVTDGRWRSAFSGKELLDAIFGHINTTGRISKVDYFRELGRSHFAGGRVPQELSEVRAALRNSVGLSP